MGKYTERIKAERLKAYKKLQQDIESSSFYTEIDLSDRVNTYRCGMCGNAEVTRDVDAGVTPMFIPCACGARKQSRGYFRSSLAWGSSSREWYRPDTHEFMRMVESMLRKPDALKAAQIDHVLKGGLILRYVITKTLTGYENRK